MILVTKTSVCVCVCVFFTLFTDRASNNSVIGDFHSGMRACVRLDDRMCSRLFAVEQGLRCVLAPLLFNIFLAAAINVASARFKADKDIMDASFGAPEEEKGGGRVGGGNCRRSCPGDAALGHALR